MQKSMMGKLIYAIRDWRSRRMFDLLRTQALGEVLDIGGWDFYQTAIAKQFSFTSWTVLERDISRLYATQDSRVQLVAGDGCAMDFPDNRFDTVLCIQVLEHVFTPNKMMQEIARVLKPGGRAILLIPQTANLHMVPYHYYNYTRFWITEACQQVHLTVTRLTPLGGFWSSIASRCVYFFLQSIRFGTMHTRECRRSILFYCLLPLMWLFAIIIIPIALLFSLADLSEEPNNHLVVASKPLA